jgi:ferrochelatase
MKISTIESWFEEPLYIESMTELIRQGLAAFTTDNKGSILLLYSAHSIPASYVEKGDPFLKQTQESVALINSNLGNINKYGLAFQSKVGPVKWLGPSTNDIIAEIGSKGQSRVLAIPISFVSDHIETLQEIDIQYKRLAEQSGIAEFCRAASLNLYPKFIDALAELSIRKFAELQ